jgi:hypothetical protein
MIGFIGTSLQLQSIISQSMTVYDSLHSLSDQERLLFHCVEWRTKNSCSHTELSRTQSVWRITLMNPGLISTTPLILSLSLSLSLMLRPTVSRPVSLGIKHTSGAYDQIVVIVWQLLVCWFRAPTLSRGRVCLLQLLLVHASAVIFGSESRRTRGHILLSQIRDFLFVASYDSQGHGGGIRPRLHTGYLL